MSNVVAIASCHVGHMSRGTGKSAVAAAAYRAGEKLENEREGQTYDYTRKVGIAYTEILTPAHAPDWMHSREQLWNSVEQVEKQCNARLALDIEARAYAQTFVNEGMIADLAIHDKKDGNPHAHLLLTTRPLNLDGSWSQKAKKAYILDEHGEKIRLKSGEFKARKITTTDWENPEKVEEWRQRYQSITNDHLERAGHAERIDVRSYERQGKDQTPTIHLGHYAYQLEQSGIPSERGEINRQIQAENREREALTKDLFQVQQALDEERTRQKTITEEALRQKFAEWERVAYSDPNWTSITVQKFNFCKGS